MDHAVINNEAKSRYELHGEGGIAVAAYERDGDVVVFTHTVVPEKLRGNGMAAKLIEDAIADVRRRGLKMRPECAYVIGYVARHPEVRDLLDRSADI